MDVARSLPSLPLELFVEVMLAGRQCTQRAVGGDQICYRTHDAHTESLATGLRGHCFDVTRPEWCPSRVDQSVGERR